MKKFLVITLAVVFALGIAGVATANPFADVPANHWAYASISRLAQAGIIEGYGGGRFVGSSNITRYEAAQVTAKALARADQADAAMKSQIDRLAAEFSKELQSLGVRVGRLERRTDNVTITGEARFSYYAPNRLTTDLETEVFRGGGGDAAPSTNKYYQGGILRTRLYLNGRVNDNWSYTGMFAHFNSLRANTHGGGSNTDFNGRLILQRAWVDGKLGVFNLTAGTFNYATAYGAVLDNDSTGVVVNLKEAGFNVDLFAIRPEINNAAYMGSAKRIQVYGTQIGYGFNDSLNAVFTWYNMNRRNDKAADNDVFELGLDYTFANSFKLWGQVLRAGRNNSFDPDVKMKKSGWAAGINFGEKNLAKPDTFELFAGYYKVPAMAVLTSTHEHWVVGNVGFGYKGYTLGASYVLAKNIDLNVEYYAFKSVDRGQGGSVTNTSKLGWTYIRFMF